VIDLSKTTSAMLEGLFDPLNEQVWSGFDARYRPIVVAFARKLGLDDADAADVAQETLTQFVKQYRQGRYDRQRSRLRSWLIGIAKYRVADLKRATARRREWRGESAIADLPDNDQLTRLWDQQRRTTMLRQALDELRANTKTHDRTIRAFELLVLEQQPCRAVAEQLAMTTQEVYLAKSRIAHRLRDVLARLDALYDGE